MYTCECVYDMIYSWLCSSLLSVLMHCTRQDVHRLEFQLNLCSPVLKFSSFVASLKGCTVLCLQTFRILQTRFRPCLTSEYFSDSDQDSTRSCETSSPGIGLYTTCLNCLKCSARQIWKSSIATLIQLASSRDWGHCDKNVLKQTSKHSFLPKIQHVEVQREPSVICARSHHMAASVWVWNALCSCLVLRLRWGVCVLGLRTLWKSFKRTKSTRSLTRYSYTPYVSHPKSSCSGDILICYDDSWYYS